jgi:hypothetical protein
MSELVAIDILVDPDAAAISRAHEINQKLLASTPEGFALDQTHQPHITTVQRFVRASELQSVYDAVGATILATDFPALAYEVQGIAHSDDWGPPGMALAGFIIQANRAVLDFQAALLNAVDPYVVSPGNGSAFVTDPGETISAKTIEWVERFVPDQVGPNYTAHITLGLDTEGHLKIMESDAFASFAVHPSSVSIYHLGNNGTARSCLQTWSVSE